MKLKPGFRRMFTQGLGPPEIEILRKVSQSLPRLLNSNPRWHQMPSTWCASNGYIEISNVGGVVGGAGAITLRVGEYALNSTWWTKDHGRSMMQAQISLVVPK